MMRQEILDLIVLGPLPNSKSPIPAISAWQASLEKINPPVTNAEAIALVQLFPMSEDDCYGLGWSLLHLIESAPGLSLKEVAGTSGNPWTTRLRSAISNRDAS